MGSPVFGECASGIPTGDFEQDAKFRAGSGKGAAITGGRVLDAFARIGNSGIGRELLLLNGPGRLRADCGHRHEPDVARGERGLWHGLHQHPA